MFKHELIYVNTFDENKYIFMSMYFTIKTNSHKPLAFITIIIIFNNLGCLVFT